MITSRHDIVTMVGSIFKIEGPLAHGREALDHDHGVHNHNYGVAYKEC